MKKIEQKRLTLVMSGRLYHKIRTIAFKKEQKMATAIRDLLESAIKGEKK